MTKRASAGALLALLSATLLSVSGCRPEGKTETVQDLPAREKAVNDSMQRNYSAGGPGAQQGGPQSGSMRGGGPPSGYMGGGGGAPAPAMMPPPPGPGGR